MNGASTFQFECLCGKKVETQEPVAATSCPKCGRPWVVEWNYEIAKAAK